MHLKLGGTRKRATSTAEDQLAHDGPAETGPDSQTASSPDGAEECGYIPNKIPLEYLAGGFVGVLIINEHNAMTKAKECHREKQIGGGIFFAVYAFSYYLNHSPVVLGLCVGVALWMQYQWKWGYLRHLKEATHWHERAHDAQATFEVLFEQRPNLRHWDPNRSPDTTISSR